MGRVERLTAHFPPADVIRHLHADLRASGRILYRHVPCLRSPGNRRYHQYHPIGGHVYHPTRAAPLPRQVVAARAGTLQSAPASTTLVAPSFMYAARSAMPTYLPLHPARRRPLTPCRTWLTWYARTKWVGCHTARRASRSQQPMPGGSLISPVSAQPAAALVWLPTYGLLTAKK